MSEEQLDSEKCVRCGEESEDLRTLWMSCLYEMSELGIPLDQCRIHGHYCRRTGTRELTSLRMRVSEYAPPDLATPARDFDFFTMRVCKPCRAEWLMAIKTWFETRTDALQQAADDKAAPGMIEMNGGVPIRVFGATVIAKKPEAE